MDLNRNDITVKMARVNCKKGIIRLMKVKNINLDDAIALQLESFLECDKTLDIAHQKEIELILNELKKELEVQFKYSTNQLKKNTPEHNRIKNLRKKELNKLIPKNST